MESHAPSKRFGLAVCAFAILLLGLAMFSGGMAQSRVVAAPVVSDAVIRLPAVSGRPAGGFFMVMGGRAADRLTGVSAPAPIRIEMHETKMQNGAMTMLPLASLPVPAGGHVMFMPGGKHLMLYDVPADVKPGDKLPLTFRFATAGSVTVNATVQAANSAPAAKDPHAGH